MFIILSLNCLTIGKYYTFISIHSKVLCFKINIKKVGIAHFYFKSSKFKLLSSIDFTFVGKPKISMKPTEAD